MGFTPQQVRVMSLWDLNAAWAGYRSANGIASAPTFPSDDDFERAVALGAEAEVANV